VVPQVSERLRLCTWRDARLGRGLRTSASQCVAPRRTLVPGWEVTRNP
jgi:hypothetical protein